MHDTIAELEKRTAPKEEPTESEQAQAAAAAMYGDPAMGMAGAPLQIGYQDPSMGYNAGYADPSMGMNGGMAPPMPQGMPGMPPQMPPQGMGYPGQMPQY